MGKSYLKELEALNKQLSDLTEEEILALFESEDLSPEEIEQYSVLEQYIIGSVYAGTLLENELSEFFPSLENHLVLAA